MVDCRPPAIHQSGHRRPDAGQHRGCLAHGLPYRRLDVIACLMHAFHRVVHYGVNTRDLSLGPVRNIAPDVGETLVILGVPSTVKLTPLLALPPTVTTTLPVVAPVGTVATIDVVLQLVIVVAAVPLNFTVFVPCEPKFNPVIVTDAPIAAEVGDKLLMLG